MPRDALGQLVDTTAAGTVDGATTHTSVDLKVGTPRRGLHARVIFWGGSVSSGAGTVEFEVRHGNASPAGTLLTSGSAYPIALGTSSVAAGEIFLPFQTESRYVALRRSVITGTGGTVNYRGDIVLVEQ